MLLIPAIDLRDGSCVRLLHGNFDAETRYEPTPRELVARYAQYGAEWVHVVDLDGARDGAAGNRQMILELAGMNAVKLQVGGGLRDTVAVSTLLEHGIGRVVIGSVAVTHPEMVRQWLRDYGPERLVIAFDVRLNMSQSPCVAIHGWREQSSKTLWSAIEDFAACGLAHVLCTDVGRDGALSGPNVQLYSEAVRRFPRIAWQASGGIRDARDLAALADIGATAAISGKALLEGLIPVEELHAFLPNA